MHIDLNMSAASDNVSSNYSNIKRYIAYWQEMLFTQDAHNLQCKA